MSLEFDVEVKGLERLLRRWERLPARIKPQVKGLLTRIVLIIERDVKIKTPKNTGRLVNSITHEVKSVGGTLQGVVGSPVQYAPFVELDTRPHWPPRRPIIYWVMRKFRLKGVAAASAARGVQRKIARRGTTGAHMFEKALEGSQGRIKAEWFEFWGKLVRDDL